MFLAKVFGIKGVELTSLDDCEHDEFVKCLDNTSSVILWSHEIAMFNAFVQSTDMSTVNHLSDAWETYRHYRLH